MFQPKVAMATILNSKGRVTNPKHMRDALHLLPGTEVVFAVNAEDEVVIRRIRTDSDRFEAMLGRADIRWKTDDLMEPLRADQ